MLFSKSKAKSHDGKDRHVDGHGVLTEADVNRAYERGRREERARRRGHPVLSLIVFAVAVMGAGMVFLAAREGSFTRGGQVLDHKLAGVAEHAQTGTILVADAGRQVVAGKASNQHSGNQTSAQN